MFCPKCGTPSKGKRFCTRCGLEQRLPRYQGAPRNACTQAVAFEAPVITNQAVTHKVAPAVITTPQRTAAAAQTMPFEQIRVEAAPALAPARGKALDKHTRKISVKTPTPPRKVSLLLAVAVVLLLAGGFGFQQYQHQSAGAQVVASPVTRPPNTPTPTPPPVLNQRWTIVADQTQQVSSAENVLAEPDQTVAVIAPGGQLALEFHAGSFFGNGPGPDVQLHSTTPAPVSYTIFVRNDATAAWQRIDINRSGFVQGTKGHDMGHHGVQQASQMLIRNDAKTDLPIDAISVLYPGQVVSAPSHHHAH